MAYLCGVLFTLFAGEMYLWITHNFKSRANSNNPLRGSVLKWTLTGGIFGLRYFVKELHSGLHLSESVMDNCRVKINKITIIYYYSSPVVFLQIGSTRYWLNSAK